MTTTAARNGTLGPTLKSIDQQKLPPDFLVVYLPPGASSDGLDYSHRMITVRCEEDLGPVMKLSAVLDRWSDTDDDYIITIDDDIIYDDQMIEQLLIASDQDPNSAIGYSGWNITDLIQPGDKGEYIFPRQPCAVDVLEGWSGALYRRRWFTPDVMKVPPEFRNVDDVWISSWLHKRGIGRKLIAQPKAKSNDLGLPGLHNRSDFKQLNREAARIGFAR